MPSELEGAISFIEWVQDRLTGRAEASRWGTALFHDSFPLVWDLNFLRVTLDAGLTVEALAAEAERLQGGAGLKHRKVQVHDERLGERLAAGFKDIGWQVERLLLMAHRRPPDRSAPRSSALEIDVEAVKRERRRSLSRDPNIKSEEAVNQLTEVAGLFKERCEARFFGAVVDGELGCTCELYSGAGTAQIEAVMTLEEHRGKGLARATILAALEVAIDEGNDLVFLTADDDDWPKELYRKLGFEDLGRFYAFARGPVSAH